jgi:P27 family predicted phage terminase small subunit
MPGPPPKPTALKKLAGNPGHRPLNDREPMPEPGLPKMPPLLRGDKVARAEWKRLATELDRLNVLTKIDGLGLAAYCKAYSRWIAAEEDITQRGVVLDSPQGRKKNPACTVVAECLKQMLSFAGQYGLTPASRSRIHASGVQGDDKNAQVEEKYFSAAVAEPFPRGPTPVCPAPQVY